MQIIIAGLRIILIQEKRRRKKKHHKILQKTHTISRLASRRQTFLPLQSKMLELQSEILWVLSWQSATMSLTWTVWGQNEQCKNGKRTVRGYVPQPVNRFLTRDAHAHTCTHTPTHTCCWGMPTAPTHRGKCTFRMPRKRSWEFLLKVQVIFDGILLTCMAQVHYV